MEYPVGKAQKIILNALGLEANTHSEAKELFDKYGIEVSSKRVGRKSIPVVTKKENLAGGFFGGDGHCTEIIYKNIDLTSIAQYLVN